MPNVNIHSRVRRVAVIGHNHTELLNDKSKWDMLPEVQLESGDILIKHIWTHLSGANRFRNPTEGLIRFGGMLHVFDRAGSQSAEHVALVGRVNGEVRIFEAEGEGIRTKKGAALAHLVANTAYSVFRFDGAPTAYRQGMQLLCDGMATRLAQIECDDPCPVHMPLYEQVREDNPIRKVVSQAHHYCEIVAGSPVFQTAKYSWARLTSPIFPTIFSDSIFSKHDKKVLEFIQGKRQHIRYICSGFAATMLQAWYINYYNKRVFTDPSTAHPTAVEHHLMKGHLGGFKRVGRHGGGLGGH